MTPEQLARDWLESSEYQRVAAEALAGTDQTPIIHPITLERNVQRSMSVDAMRELFVAIFAAGYRTRKKVNA